MKPTSWLFAGQEGYGWVILLVKTVYGQRAHRGHVIANELSDHHTEIQVREGSIKNIARSRKAALRNLIGFRGVKLFLLKYVTITTVTTATVTIELF